MKRPVEEEQFYTKKQREVLDMRAEGMNDTQIGRILNILPRTVKFRLKNAKERKCFVS